MDVRLSPLLILLIGSLMIASLRRARTVLAGRRERRAKAEAAELARMTGYLKKIRPDSAGPAITRDRRGRVELFRGLRRYANKGAKRRRGAKI